MVSATQKLENKGDKDNAEAVLQVSVKANIEIYDRIKEERDMACEALRELFKPELEAATREATQKGRQEGIELGRTEGRELGLEQGGNQMIYSLVQDGIITAEVGAKKLGISLRKLKANMVNTGFVYPGKK
jgi:flagellar biosynthesis/type III secretory pathway protein FliH